ncbi:MAG: type II and III secretion system protein family protein, partial [Pseudomonadota bacterium]
GEEQVMLQVKIAEVQRSILKQFGINLGAAFQNANGTVNVLTDNALPITTQQGLGSIGQAFVNTTTNLAGLALPQATGVANAVTNSGIGGVFAPGGGSRNISYTLKALERNGLVRTLAEPNLTAVSGESANFLAGGEFPIPVSEENGAISIAFKEFGVGLAFTPIVMSEGRISLKISTEVSELSTTGAVTLSSTSIPALTKRKTESTVELPSGGTLALSGLVSHSMQKNIDGFPGLKELPVLGTLFRSTDFANKETELVVIVTPYIVRPTARKKLAAPTDGLVSATDVRTYLLGHLNRVHGRSVALPAGSTKDGIGFIVE